MSGPIVYISHFRIKEGREDEWWSMVDQVLPGLEAAKPRTVFQHFYAEPSGRTISIIHIFGDAAAMDLHAEGGTARSQTAYEYLEPIAFEIYGQPTESFLATMRDIPDIDRLLRVEPDHRAGYSRFAG
jgi:hypothetical protein